jgi:hypothetical protein
MKTLDLNACGVHEMNAGEMKKSDGGLGCFAAIAIIVIIGIFYPQL